MGETDGALWSFVLVVISCDGLSGTGAAGDQVKDVATALLACSLPAMSFGLLAGPVYSYGLMYYI